MDVAAVREGLAEAARAVQGLTCFGYVPDSVPEPVFYTGEVEINYDLAYGRGLDEMYVTCVLLVSRADDLSGQRKLDGYLAGSGPRSVKAAIEAARGGPGEPALGGAADDLRVTRVQGYRLYQVGHAEYVGAELLVRVIGEG